MNSLRAKGVMSFQAASAVALVLPDVRSRQRRLMAADQPAGSLGLLRIMQRAPLRERLRAARYALLPSRAYRISRAKGPPQPLRPASRSGTTPGSRRRP